MSASDASAALDAAASDTALVQRMARGDRAAMMSLYDRYAAAMLGVGARILGDRAEAEDLLHDVFLEAWESAAEYDPSRGKVSTWLLLRLRSRALDRIRAVGRSRTILSEEPISHDEPSLRDPALAADRRALGRVFVELPREQRQVLELAYHDGLSSSEIAARLGISIGTVKSRTAAALGKLRLKLRVGVEP